MNTWTNEYLAGYLPLIITDRDVRPVKDQIADRYAHGGGYMPFEGFALSGPDLVGQASIKYPGDPAMQEVSRYQCNDELCILFEASWLAIIQTDGTYVITRVD